MAVIGSVIDGKYEILTLIGQGGMSKVYLAMDKRLNKQWAVKEIEKRARDKNNEVIIRSAIEEANMIKRLDHPSLPRIVDIIDNGNVIFVIMDYIEGEPLSTILMRNGAQPQELVIEWAKELCGVLDYLHTCNPPIIYRDMKPANVMLKPDGSLKLIDFGIAREFKENKLSDTVSLGTKGYAAPEQFGGKGQTDARTDVYGLGVTLYHLITGQNPCEPPYELYPIRYWNPGLSAGLEKIILKCTQLNPDDRYQSCAELMYALNHYVEADDAYRHKQKRKIKIFAAALLFGFLFLGIGMGAGFLKNKINAEDYNSKLIQADIAVSDEEKIKLYIEAVDIKPNKLEAYMGLVETFKADAVFGIEEEITLRQTVNSHIKTLQNNKDYSDLAFEIGKLYWYYYEYGKTEGTDNQLTRMKSAIQWFDDVAEFGDGTKDYYKMSIIYRDIGIFNRDITINVAEGAEKGQYEKYYFKIKELLGIIEVSPDESEIVKLELYRLIMYSIENYVKNFKETGILYEDVQGMYDKVKELTENMSPNAEVTEEIKEEVTRRFEQTQKSIDNAFGKGD
ncbi:MAG: serine/threonine protein kinase [Lachnospiraceae bacterium]|nr:serine/threonine protein kinase [Lachnospiraceae bacterium]